MIQKLKTCRFKIDMKNFANFDPSTRKSKKFVLIGSLLAKYILFELKNLEELSFMTLKRYANFEEKLTCGLKKEICQTITRALQRVKAGTLMGSFFPKWKMYDLKTCREVMCHDNEE